MALIQLHLVAAYSIAVAYILTFAFVSGDDVVIQKRPERSGLDMEHFIEQYRQKRPFCNSFAGCGKKRTDETMATLVDLRSEPAVEELSRQILSEAKLWEAIQEARAEMERRRQEKENMISRDFPFEYSMANFRRKRSIGVNDHGSPNNRGKE